MIDTGLKDKVILITGANHGIGAATAKAFAAQGAKVFINYLRLSIEPSTGNQAEAEKTGTPGEALYRARQALSADQVLQAIRNSGGQAEAWEADLADPATIPALFDHAEAAFGPVDVLINNATHCEPDTLIPQTQAGHKDNATRIFPMQTITPQGIDQHFIVNSRAVALMMTEYVSRHIIRGAHWGRIINVSSDGAPIFPGTVSYGASKYAMESYSRAAAVEFGKYGITVNIVSPGPIQTGYITPDLEQREAAKTPLGRIGQPEDVADVIVFLASEQARWLTGQILFVGGGHRMI